MFLFNKEYYTTGIFGDTVGAIYLFLVLVLLLNTSHHWHASYMIVPVIPFD